MSSVERWVEHAQYDIETARAMLDSGRHFYVLFCCQPAIEKSFKALILQQTNELPPRIHNLLRLAELAGSTLSEGQKMLLGDLSGYYIRTRYPEEMQSVGKSVNHETAKGFLHQSEEMVRWLLSTRT